MVMKGLTPSTLRHHYALIPLFVAVGGGCCWSAFYLGRLALRSPDVKWFNKTGEASNTELPFNYQHKFFFWDKKTDYKDMKPPAERPNIEEMWRKHQEKEKMKP